MPAVLHLADELVEATASAAVAFDAGDDLVAQLVAGDGRLADLVGAVVLDLGVTG